MTTIVGHASAGVNGILTASLPPFALLRTDAIDDSVTGFGDLYPIATLKWNQGVHNWMVYVNGDIPVGAYDRTRLINVGIGHGAVDAGGGYTYFNPQAGVEFSAVKTIARECRVFSGVTVVTNARVLANLPGPNTFAGTTSG